MLVKSFLRRFAGRYLDGELEFRVRLFNLLAMAGIGVSFISIFVPLLAGQKLYISLTFAASCALSFALMEYARRSGRYHRCYIITITVIFLIGFPAFFLLRFAYYSSLPYFFVFAVVFTAVMLPGRQALFFASLELAVYIGVCLWAHYFFLPPGFSLPGRTLMLICIFGFTTVSVALGLCVHALFRLYNAQQKQLARQNRILEQVSLMKTELLANVSHEMKTPLTVISVHIQRAQALMGLGREGDAEKIRESFALAQEEIMRLSRLVGSALELSSMRELGGAQDLVDTGGVLYATAEAYRPFLEKGGNTLLLDLPCALPPLCGSADALVQMVSNLLSNAGRHTRGGVIRIRVVQEGESVAITVSDTGEGIAPELLPLVFRRGVSGRGGSGLGLSICKELAEAHGGSVGIESQPNIQTVATLTLPLGKEALIHAQRQTAAH